MKAAALLLFLSSLFVARVSIEALFHADENGESLRGFAAVRGEQRHLKSDPNIIKVLVKYKTELGKHAAMEQALKVTHESNLFNILGMEIPVQALNVLQNNANIERVDLDLEVQAILSIEEEQEDEDNEDPEIAASKFNMKHQRQLIEQVPWNIRAVQADQVQPGPYAHEIKVCIIDTGYDIDHPDLPGPDTVQGTDSTKYSNRAGNQWDEDGRGHGTHAAGVLAAIGNNNVGIRGILQDANPNGFTLHISKGLNDAGRGSVSGVIEAIEGCINAKSDIITMSFRVGGGFVPSFNEALQSAYLDHDILLVAAGKVIASWGLLCGHTYSHTSVTFFEMQHSRQ